MKKGLTQTPFIFWPGISGGVARDAPFRCPWPRPGLGVAGTSPSFTLLLALITNYLVNIHLSLLERINDDL